MIGWAAVGVAGLLSLLALSSGKSSDQVIIDRRSKARLTPDAKKHTTVRPAGQVMGLTLHQMGFDRGNDPASYNKVTAHFIVLRDGKVYQLHDITQRLPASSGLNRGTVAVEFAGNLPSRARSTDKKAFFEPDKFGMDQLTPEQVAGGRALVKHLVETSAITHIYAHRQGGRKRENCPGPDVWREVGAWAVQQYGLQSEGPGWKGAYADKYNAGQPIPEAWWLPPTNEEDVIA